MSQIDPKKKIVKFIGTTAKDSGLDVSLLDKFSKTSGDVTLRGLRAGPGTTIALVDADKNNATLGKVIEVTAGGGGAVSSVFGRTGAVVATLGDYTASQITNFPSGNLSAVNVQAALNELQGDIDTLTLSTTFIEDADNDTSVEVERTPNDNLVRMKASGTDIFIASDNQIILTSVGTQFFMGIDDSGFFNTGFPGTGVRSTDGTLEFVSGVFDVPGPGLSPLHGWIHPVTGAVMGATISTTDACFTYYDGSIATRLCVDDSHQLTAIIQNQQALLGEDTAGQLSWTLQNSASGSGLTNELRFAELSTTGSNYVGFKAPDSVGTPTVWTLPDSDGVSGGALQTDGSGTLSWSSGVTPSLVQREYTKSVSNTTVEVDLINYLVPANQLGTDRALEVDAKFGFLNNSGSNAIFRLRIYYGGNLLYDDVSTNAGPNAVMRPFNVNFKLANRGVTNSQIMSGITTFGVAAPGTTVGHGNLGTDEIGGGGPILGFGTEDSTFSAALRVTVSLNVTNPLLSMETLYGTVTLI